MTSDQLKALLTTLKSELESGAPVSPELRDLLEGVDQDIRKVLDAVPPEQGDDAELSARVLELETRFAADHPVLATHVRNLLDALGKMGI